MKRTLFVLLAFGAGIALALWWRREPPAPVDPVQVILTQIRTHAIVEQERQIAVWYRACPEVVGVNPELFIAWPGRLSYELELQDVEIERRGDTLHVKTRAIHADEPTVPTDFTDYLASATLFNLANEEQLVNQEIAKASAISRYLSAYYLKRDPSLVADFERELGELVLRIAGVADPTLTKVDVELPAPDPAFPKLPTLELCEGARAAVNGLPFAKLEEGHVIPIGFSPANAGGTPQGIASFCCSR